MNKPNLIKKGLTPVLDTGDVKRELPPACSSVQIAHRFALFVPGYKPRGFVDIDPVLYDAMDVGNQAALLLHEAIYVLEAELGQKDSEMTRDFVRFIFTKREEMHTYFMGIDGTSDGTRALILNQDMDRHGFNNFLGLFLPSLPPNAPPSNLTRQASYLKYSQRESRSTNLLSDEEAFMRFALDRGGRDDLPVVQDLFIDTVGEQEKLGKMCHLARKLVGNHSDVLVSVDQLLYQKAAAYCSRIGK